jgi:hypothetical protein
MANGIGGRGGGLARFPRSLSFFLSLKKIKTRMKRKGVPFFFLIKKTSRDGLKAYMGVRRGGLGAGLRHSFYKS